jgi:quinoprotein glucose dehydrogenase
MTSRLACRFVFAAGFVVAFGASAGSQDEPADPYQGKIAKASNAGQLAIGGFKRAKDIDVTLVAAEPLLANPVAFCFDEKGRLFVAETYRLHAGVTDNRSMAKWLIDDLCSRAVADRLTMYHKHLGKQFATYGKDQDRVRMLLDTDGDGVYDKSVVYAGGFNRPEDGLGSGLIAKHGKVWYTNIPDLWLLQDTKGDGKADVKKSLSTGYGVHVSFIGHDSHGLRFGPDGKLYFSIGDRGLHVIQDGHVLDNPDSGAVLRCNPDGTELELVATGLRNPQELAFDQYGNLFTGDNNADSGDAARWVYVVDGGDSGWRIGYQYLKSPPATLGPWNAEKLWHLPFPGQAAYVLPPLAHIASGPSGLTYNPGVTLLPEHYKDHFFLCDFRGQPGGSGIHSFALKPHGASYELVDRSKLIDNVLVTDCDFGPDGGFYLSDWVNGWGLPMKGRIYKLFDPQRKMDKKVAEVKKLLAEGMAKRSLKELGKLLEHDDQRVRQEAQFALAERGCNANADGVLGLAALKSKHLLARLHGLWGLGQIGRKEVYPMRVLIAKNYLLPCLTDREPEVRAQAAKVLGEFKYSAAPAQVVALLKDPSPRVRFFAAMSLAKMDDRDVIGAVLDMLRDNKDQDAYLRHAGVMALAKLADAKTLMAHAKDASPAVRMAVLLTMRRLHLPEISQFLNDADPNLVLEAARAINDVPIDTGLSQLAAAASRTGLPPAFTYRALNAHFRLGKKENAEALAQYAAKASAPEAMRLEALQHLANWANPPRLDRVTGLWRPPMSPRPKEIAADAIRAALGGILSGSTKVREEAAKVAGKLGIKEMGPALFALVQNKDQPSAARVAGLKGLEALKDQQLGKAIDLALLDTDPHVRAEGLRQFVQVYPVYALPQIEKVLKKGSIVEKQQAFVLLGTLKDNKTDPILLDWLDRLKAGTVAEEIQLELLEAAAKRKSAEVQAKLTQHEMSRPKGSEIAPYLETLHGGNAESGRKIFFEKSEVSCVRCHKINGIGGDVGPDLSHIAKDYKRDYLLESIVAPSKQIAKGYESVTLVLTNGQIKMGILKGEDAKQVQLMTAEGTMLSVPKEQIDERLKGKSAMPEDLTKHLSKSELRDLVEFLSSLR